VKVRKIDDDIAAHAMSDTNERSRHLLAEMVNDAQKVPGIVRPARDGNVNISVNGPDKEKQLWTYVHFPASLR
jgi:hypothetical protein